MTFRAIILAAGRGSRMKDETLDLPKCLVKLDGKPILERTIMTLRRSGIEQIAIVTGYKGEQLHSYGDAHFHNHEWSSTNMVASLICASEWLSLSPCLVSYSDIFYEASAVKSLLATNSEVSITYDLNWQNLWQNRFTNPLEDAETFKLNEKNDVIEIGNTPKSIDEVDGQYMGLIKFSVNGWKKFKELADSLPSQKLNTIDMTKMLQLAVETENFKVKGVPYSGVWGEIDSKDDLLFYNSSKFGVTSQE